jgi:hypothetical protein
MLLRRLIDMAGERKKTNISGEGFKSQCWRIGHPESVDPAYFELTGTIRHPRPSVADKA